MKYRSRIDIIARILMAATHGVTKTHLMYSAYLSYAQIQEYLAFLQEKGLILLDEEAKYVLTERGLHFLRVYDEISEAITIGKDAESGVRSFCRPRNSRVMTHSSP
jgi:predicted transcriptional regulator